MEEDPKKPALCMFCGGDEPLGPMNTEHFVPKCLWAGPRPNGTLTLPAHVACNSKFTDDNDYFRTILVADDGTEEHPEARRLKDTKLKRMMENRPGQWSRYSKNAKVRPRFTRSGIYLGHQHGFPIDQNKMERVLKNIVKGIFYSVTGNPLPQTTRITVENAEGENDPVHIPMVEAMGNWTSFGDDVFTCRLVLCSDMADLACLMSFYRKKFFYAHTERMPKPPEDPPLEAAHILR